jgi:hypothetical protein
MQVKIMRETVSIPRKGPVLVSNKNSNFAGYSFTSCTSTLLILNLTLPVCMVFGQYRLQPGQEGKFCFDEKSSWVFSSRFFRFFGNIIFIAPQVPCICVGFYFNEKRFFSISCAFSAKADQTSGLEYRTKKTLFQQN